MTPLAYLTKYRSEWQNKPEKEQRIILDELCNDWSNKYAKGKDHGEFFDAFNEPNNQKYWSALK